MARKSGKFRIGSRSLAQPDVLGLLVSPKAFRVAIPVGEMARRQAVERFGYSKIPRLWPMPFIFRQASSTSQLTLAVRQSFLFHGFRCTGGTSDFAAEVAHEIHPGPVGQ